MRTHAKGPGPTAVSGGARPFEIRPGPGRRAIGASGRPVQLVEALPVDLAAAGAGLAEVLEPLVELPPVDEPPVEEPLPAAAAEEPAPTELLEDERLSVR
ncbi:hypothetical protein GCM10010495_40590 [Kitasatospora herbaricolor]|nr:hypothetical protein GCM10010495_40590 [Kitasatospora herbaricolor]